ncbi:MAG: small subunit ribosomal protein [Solirubrobacteraceae bacterium]|nr:small subunit ribosomal protein [Solirubrobacteraceae bacterium]
MATEPTIYDLVLLLSTNTEEDDRAKVLSEVEAAITSSGGTIERNQDWGTRPLTYRINHQGDAEYHLLQFQGPTTLLDSLSHSLRIADGVLRFRIIKVIPGTPPAPDSAPPLVAPAATASAGAPSPVPVAVAAAPDDAGTVSAGDSDSDDGAES